MRESQNVGVDSEDLLRPAFFRTLLTLLIPGAAASLPVTFKIMSSPIGTAYLKESGPIVLAVLFLLACSCGMILDNVARQLEVSVVDWLLHWKNGHHKIDQLDFLDKPSRFFDRVGRQYYADLETKLRFEFSFGLSLILFWYGTFRQMRAGFRGSTWSYDDGFYFTEFVLSVAAYLIWQGFCSAAQLGAMRHRLLHNRAELTARADPAWTPDEATRIKRAMVISGTLALCAFFYDLMLYLRGDPERLHVDSGFAETVLVLALSLAIARAHTLVHYEKVKGREGVYTVYSVIAAASAFGVFCIIRARYADTVQAPTDIFLAAAIALALSILGGRPMIDHLRQVFRS